VARARQEVVMAAGAVGTPSILQRSGVGDGAFLHGLGITPVHELPGVGGNLQDHLQIRAVFQVDGVPTLNTLAQTWWGKARIGLDYALRRRGPMSMAPSQLGAFTRSSERYAWPNVQYHVQPLSLEAFGEPLHASTPSPPASATSTRHPAAASGSPRPTPRPPRPSWPTTSAPRKTARSRPIRCA
jgi:choline dehydrogenase